jgi:ABC-2 type transport system permease protein
MSQVLAIALKDLKLLFRVPMALFFTMVWPLLVAIIFGALFGGNRGTPRLAIAVTDEDQTAASREFVDGLAAREGFDVLRVADAEARDLVRRGRRSAAVLLPKGFGAASDHLFFGTPPRVDLRTDPAHQAETAMLQGLLFEQGARRMQTFFSDPVKGRAMIAGSLDDVRHAPAGAIAGQSSLQTMLGSLDTFLVEQAHATAPSKSTATPWQPLDIHVTSVQPHREGPSNGFQITFPQGIQWGILGCMMSFAVSLAVERSRGTLTRLLMSPAPSWALLAGKGLACYLAILMVQAMLGILGWTLFDVRPNLPLFVLAALVVPLAFVGLMMLIASIGTTEQTAAGAGWALMMPMSMIGGGMVPLAVMPSWMGAISYISPVRWAIISYEGAIWREFSLGEMLLPCAILMTMGLVAFALGARRFRASNA